MTRTVDVPLSEIVPTEEALVRALGGTPDQAAGDRVRRLLGDALDELRALAEPRGIFAEVDAREFAGIYEGAGDNEDPSPLLEIFARGDSIALFAVTVGAPLSDRIAALFDAGEPALGATLDAAASEGTELAGAHLDRLVLSEAREEGTANAATRVLRYSPGYCGWNITGQRALFAALGPEEIGIRLTESCLMEPLKSISGVMVMGPAEVHEFESDYRFCSDCRTKICRSRIRALKTRDPEGDDDGDPGHDRR